MSQFHLPANIDSNGNIYQQKGQLLEILVLLGVLADLVQSMKILFPFLLIMEAEKVLSNLNDSIFSIFYGLNL